MMQVVGMAMARLLLGELEACCLIKFRQPRQERRHVCNPTSTAKLKIGRGDPPLKTQVSRKLSPAFIIRVGKPVAWHLRGLHGAMRAEMTAAYLFAFGVRARTHERRAAISGRRAWPTV
ncbi:hypothetical protein E2C01_047283 [Portunus trituberculatus]|uniref:Secreted protein n=1 Tax=Portunus trituberculatus TaxID=210409 RepID=A0A5B7G7J8_PORTR|nr:hypothetical protein [Portunus trituberculatus]